VSAVGDHVPERLSWSRIRAYLTCSLQYFFRYVAQEKPEFTPGALAFGSALHRAMEESLVGQMAGQEIDLDHLIVTFGTSLDEAEVEAAIRWPERDNRESVTAQAKTMLDIWLRHPRSGKILGVEESFEVELTPWLRLSGRVDVVEETDDGYLLLTDLKSSRAAWGDEQVLQGQDQLVLYREGLRPLIEAVGKPVKLAWEVILKQKAPRVERIELTDPPSADRAIRTATIVQEAISKQIFVPSPGAMQCHGCPYRAACRDW